MLAKLHCLRILSSILHYLYPLLHIKCAGRRRILQNGRKKSHFGLHLKGKRMFSMLLSMQTAPLAKKCVRIYFKIIFRNISACGGGGREYVFEPMKPHAGRCWLCCRSIGKLRSPTLNQLVTLLNIAYLQRNILSNLYFVVLMSLSCGYSTIYHNLYIHV
jgi:hypothetical protein